MVKITFAKQHYIGIRARYGGNRFVMAKLFRARKSHGVNLFFMAKTIRRLVDDL